MIYNLILLYSNTTSTTMTSVSDKVTQQTLTPNKTEGDNKAVSDQVKPHTDTGAKDVKAKLQNCSLNDETKDTADQSAN